MTRRLPLSDVATLVATALLATLAIGVATHGPIGPIPMHFDIHGRPDRWGDRIELAAVLSGLALLSALVGFAMSRAARLSADAARTRGLRLGQWLVAVAISGTGTLMTWAILRVAGEGALGQSGLAGLMAGMGLLFTGAGAFLGRVPPNLVAGVRTPWAFKSRLAWDRSNRLAGRLMFWIGLASLVASPLAPQPGGLIVQAVMIALALIWSAIDSWRVWRVDPDRQPF